MKTFKTPKGTELPIMEIKGRDYLQAAPRILWLREEHPDWSIETELLNFTDKQAVFKATIRDGVGKIVAQATSMETVSGFESFLEKAETCAVSRAAAFCGYGTLMAQELEEQEKNSEHIKLAESPIEGRKPAVPLKAVPASDEPGAYVIKCNPFKDKRLDQVGQHDINEWIRRWDGKQISGVLAEAIKEASKYLDFVERKTK